MAGLDTAAGAGVVSPLVEPVPTGVQQPSMPDPARVVRQSIRLCMRPGWPHQLASLEVMAAAQRAIAALEVVGIRDVWWLQAIKAEALRQSGLQAAPTPHHQGVRDDSATTGRDR